MSTGNTPRLCRHCGNHVDPIPHMVPRRFRFGTTYGIYWCQTHPDMRIIEVFGEGGGFHSAKEWLAQHRHEIEWLDEEELYT
jgi:hypothetical protein